MMASARRTAHTRFPQGARPLMAAATIRDDSIPSSDRCNRSSKMFIFPRDLPILGEKQEKKKEEKELWPELSSTQTDFHGSGS